VSYQTVGRLHSSAEEDFFGVETHGRCTQIAVFKRLPGAKGPYDGDLECFDEQKLEQVKNFKFPSKEQIDKMKISYTFSNWDNEDFDNYEYSEDNTNLDDEVDPEWWQAVWNKEEEDEKNGSGNGQGWNDDDKSILHHLDDESVLHCWKSKDFWIEELSKPKGNENTAMKNTSTKKEESEHWHIKVPWSEEKSKDDGCSWACSPRSSRHQSDDDKARSEEDIPVLPNFSYRKQHTQTESFSHDCSVHTKKPHEWVFDMENKAEEQGEINLPSQKVATQKVLGALKFQNSCRS